MRGRSWQSTRSNASVLPLTLDSSETQLPQSFASSLSKPSQIASAHAFGFRMVAAWWRALTSKDHRAQPLRELFQVIDTGVLPASEAKKADNQGEAAACSDPALAGYQLGRAYTSRLPREHRADLGIYYTPPNLAERLIDQATEAGVDWACARVLDPACGGGAFLAPVALRIVQELQHCSPRILVENIGLRLRGYEIDLSVHGCLRLLSTPCFCRLRPKRRHDYRLSSLSAIAFALHRCLSISIW